MGGLRAPQFPELSPRVRKRYLLRGEVPVVSTRSHWIQLVEPVATSIAALFVTLLYATSTNFGDGVVMLWVVFFALAARALWRYWNWRAEWFVATDRRLLRTYGVLNHRVAMMPLAKVTDMSYDRSLIGRIVGYGEFVMESAGQDQALREINFIPRPDEKYHALIGTIFGEDVADPTEDGPEWDRSSPGHDRGYAEPPRRWAPVEREEDPREWDWVEAEAQRARSATRRRSVAVDPDPTPYQ
ncbi:MAG: PH domain-containing protein [Ornithinimicrobium sp.]|uniref:PH domain-containing protein n=1 Tax=Ornithinimicrobium sp. TaxID=1977084 RepID=UPI0026E06582|nr:PH domain-containing protein [Ornithinimicrobium sp.]MDO5740832.1 PH domain-containing protein [Ornithinimicrobium sp.]